MSLYILSRNHPRQPWEGDPVSRWLIRLIVVQAVLLAACAVFGTEWWQ